MRSLQLYKTNAVDVVRKVSKVGDGFGGRKRRRFDGGRLQQVCPFLLIPLSNSSLTGLPIKVTTSRKTRPQGSSPRDFFALFLQFKIKKNYR
jgi:hypothetical protein